MSRNLSAVGYESVEGSLYAPPKITAKIVYNYHICTVTPQIAKNDMLSDDELFCGAKVIFGVEQDLDIFGMEADINEHPETMSGPGIDSASLTICQARKFKWKISNHDKRIMCSRFSEWEANVRRQISKNITRLIDAYSIPKIIASAHPDHVGTNAGKLSHSINLGDQGSNALHANTKEGFEDLVLNLKQLALEAGMDCGVGEQAGDGESAQPVILIPAELERYALLNLKDLNQCCSENNVMVTGEIASNFYGFKIIVTRWLQPETFGAAGRLAPVVMLDPNRVLHAFDVVTNKWYEDMFEDYLVGEFVWDTHVMNSYGVAVAISKV